MQSNRSTQTAENDAVERPTRTTSRRQLLRSLGGAISIGSIGGIARAGSTTQDTSSAWHGNWEGTATVKTYEVYTTSRENAITSYSPIGSYQLDNVVGFFNPPVQSDLTTESNPLNFHISGITESGLANGDFWLQSAVVQAPTPDYPQTGVSQFWNLDLSGNTLNGYIVDQQVLRDLDAFNVVCATDAVAESAGVGTPIPYDLMALSQMGARRSGNEIVFQVVPPQVGQRIDSDLIIYTGEMLTRLTRR